MSFQPRHLQLGAVSGEHPTPQPSSSLPDFATGKPCHETRLGLPGSSRWQTQLLDLSALRPPPVAPHATVNVEGTPETEPKPAQPPQMLARTVCDKGALRDYARQLAAQTPKATHGQSERAPDAGALPLASAAAQKRHRASALVGALARSCAALRRSLAALRRSLAALPIRQRLIAVPVLAALVLLPWLWVADGGSHAAELPSATPEPVSNALAEVVTETVAEPDPGPRPSAPARAQASPRLEHDAFRAAFSGNVSEAVTLYEQLASERVEPVFQHAARLSRQNRVYKP